MLCQASVIEDVAVREVYNTVGIKRMVETKQQSFLAAGM